MKWDALYQLPGFGSRICLRTFQKGLEDVRVVQWVVFMDFGRPAAALKVSVQ